MALEGTEIESARNYAANTLPRPLLPLLAPPPLRSPSRHIFSCHSRLLTASRRYTLSKRTESPIERSGREGSVAWYIHGVPKIIARIRNRDEKTAEHNFVARNFAPEAIAFESSFGTQALTFPRSENGESRPVVLGVRFLSNSRSN